MLLVPCPYCGPRPEVEFRCGGEAHVAAARSGRRQRRGSGALPLLPHEPEGPAPRALVPPPRLRPLVQRDPRHRDRSVRASYTVGEPPLGEEPMSRLADRRQDRSRAGRSRFSFDGRGYRGFAGDTLASALLANGVHLVGRSFKYHRPRGIMTAGAEEPSALVQLERPGGRSDPNLRATEIELYDGLTRDQPEPLAVARLRRRRGERSALAAVPAGFYYKTFQWPAALVEVGLRAVHPPRRRPRPGAHEARPRPLPAPPRPLRRAGGRRRPGRADGGAGRRPQRRAGHPV